MGIDGTKGLPRVIVDAMAYIRADGISRLVFVTIGLATEGLFRIPPLQSLLQHAIAAYDRGHPVDLRDYGPNVAASLIKQYLNLLPMPVFPAHIYPALQKFPSIPENERTEYIQRQVLAKLDTCNVVLLSAVMSLLNGIRFMIHANADVASAQVLTKMPSINLSIVISMTLIHHPHDPYLDAQLSNPHKNGGAALVVIHMIDHPEDVFPNKPLPPPPMPPRPNSTPPETTRHELSPTRFLSEESRPSLNKKNSTVRLVSADSTKSAGEPSSPLIAVPTTSLSTPLPSAEFGQASPLKNKGRNAPQLGSGVVEELKKVYEERCRIVKSHEPGRKENGLGVTLTKPISRGGMGIGIGRVS
jgi:RhoGAP domain